jgi:hypothetical protein
VTRRLSLLAGLVLSLGAAATVASTGAGSSIAESPTAPAQACAGLQRQITVMAVDSLAAAWLVDLAATHGGRLEGPFGRPMWSQYSLREAAREQRMLDRRAALFARKYGTKELGGCVGQARHASGAARLFAEYACIAKGSGWGAPIAAALGEQLWAEDGGTSMDKCIKRKAHSPTLARLARTQAEAARSCRVHLTAGPSASGSERVTFGTCILQAFER